MERRTGGAQGSRFVGVEPLEQRSLMAGDFAFVGITSGTDQATMLVWGEGAFAEDGSATGSQMTAQFGGAVQSEGLPFDHATLGPGGTFSVTPAAGHPDLISEAGGNPFSSLGYGVGFLTTEHSTIFGPSRTDLWMVEKPQDFGANWTGSFTFRAVRLTANGQDIVDGSFSFIFGSGQQPTAVSWVVGGAGAVVKTIASLSPDDGKVVLDSGEVIFITTNADDTASNTVALVADLNSADGEMLVGIGGAGTTFDLGNSSQFIRGLYRGMAVSGEAGAAFFGAGDGGASAFVLDLGQGGTFSLYEARAYDNGGRDAVTTGTWRVSMSSEFPTYAFSSVLLTSAATGNIAVLSLEEDFTLTGESVRNASGQVLEQLAAGLRTVLSTNVETLAGTTTVDLDENGRPILYLESFTPDQGAPDAWYSLDLIERAGEKALTRVEILNPDGSPTTSIVAGVATDGHVVTWERDARGQWLFRDLTDEFDAQGAAPITGDSAIFRGVRLTNFRLFVSGVQGSDLVSYEPVGATDDFGVEKWTFTNVTQDELEPFGESTPIWQTGTVFGYGTVWGAVNIAGLNSAGEIVVAWTAPGLDHWYVNNLSEIAGTIPLAGSLMAYVTDWSAIHINGLSPDGRLIVTWWAPANLGQWYTNDLTTEFSGPTLPPTLAGNSPNTLVFFEGIAGSLNVAGIDAGGDTVVYWWHPGAPGWMAGNLTAAVADTDRPARLQSAETFMAVNFESELATQQTVYGLDDEGHLVRLYWDDHLPDQWRFEDIAGTAAELTA